MSQSSSSKKYNLFLAFVLAVIIGVMVMGGVLEGRGPKEQEQQGLLVTHTQEVLGRLDLLVRHITDAETGQRGYLLTGHEDYLEPYIAALKQINDDEAGLNIIFADEPEQLSAFSDLQEHVASKLGELKETIDLKKQTQNDQAMAIVLSDRGQQEMALVRKAIDTLQQNERTRLEQQIVSWHSAALKTEQLFFMGGAFICLLIFIVCFTLYKEIRHRQALADYERAAGIQQRLETERLTRVVEIQREVANHHMDLPKAMQVISEQTQLLTHAEGAIVEILEDDQMVYKAASGSGAAFLGLRLKAKSSLSGKSIAENIILKCDDSETDPRVDREACRKVGLRSMVVVPLRHNGTAIGVLKVTSPKINAFNESDITALELMGGVLSAAMNDALASQALEAANKQLEEFATTDSLTKLKNRRIFFEQLRSEFSRARRYKSPLALLLLDIDHFKKLNDTFGHPVGDAVLKSVADILKNLARETDCVARYGGEEFVVLLPETDEQGAFVIAERIRTSIAKAAWEHTPITASLGISLFQSAFKNPEELIETADKALYQSKAAGRNRVSVFSATA